MRKEQYETVIAVLAEKVKSLETDICIKDYEIERLRRLLAEAEGMEAPQEKKSK